MKNKKCLTLLLVSGLFISGHALATGGSKLPPPDKDSAVERVVDTLSDWFKRD